MIRTKPQELNKSKKDKSIKEKEGYIINEITGEILETKFNKTLIHLKNLKTRTRDLLSYVSKLSDNDKCKYYYLLKDRFKNFDNEFEYNDNSEYLYDKIYNCHTYLKFKHYVELNKYKLAEAKHCDQHLLCPICAIRRASKKLKVYQDKTNSILKDYESQNIEVNLYHIILTVKNSDDLVERYEHITTILKKLLYRRRMAKSKTKKSSNYAKNSMFSDSIAGVYTVEIKRGANSKLWHPHIHLLLLTTQKLKKKLIREEYKKVSEDSTNIEIIVVNKDNLEKQFYELFKYALKFSDMEFGDNLTAFESLRGKRLVGSFGEYRGLDVDKELDDDLDQINHYVELLYKYDGDKQYYRFICSSSDKI
jgi:hypothetical protein